MTVQEKPPGPGQPGFVSYIPESAPFTPEQRDWLNGFFAGFLAEQSASPPPLSAAADPAFADPIAGDDDEAPRHHPTFKMAERLEMPKRPPLRRRMMPATAQH